MSATVYAAICMTCGEFRITYPPRSTDKGARRCKPCRAGKYPPDVQGAPTIDVDAGHKWINHREDEGDK